MTEKTYEEALEKCLADLGILLECKHRDYGTQNLIKFGELGILVRCTDKVERLHNLYKNGGAALKSETSRDTWVDLAGYAIQAILMSDGKFELPMEDKQKPNCSEDANDFIINTIIDKVEDFFKEEQ